MDVPVLAAASLSPATNPFVVSPRVAAGGIALNSAATTMEGSGDAETTLTNKLRGYIHFLNAGCKCTEKQVGYGYFVLVFIVITAIYAITVYVIGVENAKNYLREKVQLRQSVKRNATNAASASASPSTTATGSPVVTANSGTNNATVATQQQQQPQAQSSQGNNVPSDWLRWIKQQRFGDDNKGHYFAFTENGTMLAHGKAKLLGNTQMLDLLEKDRPLTRMVAVAKQGGGYVHYRWRKERIMVAYVYPVGDTGVILAGAIPVPPHARAGAASRIASARTIVPGSLPSSTTTTSSSSTTPAPAPMSMMNSISSGAARLLSGGR